LAPFGPFGPFLALAEAVALPLSEELEAAYAPPNIANTRAITEMTPGMPKRARSVENI
jgi:hypothetical protein